LRVPRHSLFAIISELRLVSEVMPGLLAGRASPTRWNCCRQP